MYYRCIHPSHVLTMIYHDVNPFFFPWDYVLTRIRVGNSFCPGMTKETLFPDLSFDPKKLGLIHWIYDTLTPQDFAILPPMLLLKN